jgi:CheY-like chemotaxis protein
MTAGRDILVVDDIPANLLAMEAVLEPLNVRIATASSGKAALAQLLEKDFSLIFLDVQMPEMDGYETAKWIRSRERSRHTPIIFVTAHDHNEAAVLKAYRLGAVDFLFKPINAEIVRAKTQCFVDLAEAHDQDRLAATYLPPLSGK